MPSMRPFCLVLLGCCACSNADDHATVDVPSPSIIMTSGSVASTTDAGFDDSARLVGVWHNTDSKLGDCVEEHTFKASGALTIASTSGEVIDATYILQRSYKPELPDRLTKRAVRDNKLPDCLGSSKDETGAMVTEYVQFSNDDRTVELYRDEALTELRYGLEKQ
jgi:hypothetical protein